MSKLVCMGLAALTLAFAGCEDAGSGRWGSGEGAMGAIAVTGDTVAGDRNPLYLFQ